MSALEKPKVLVKKLETGPTLVRFSDLEDVFWYDRYENNPLGLGHNTFSGERRDSDDYFSQRNKLDSRKLRIIRKAKKAIQVDKDFLDLVYKAKSVKREFKLTKFGGNLSIPHYASNSEKIFKRSKVGAKKATLNMAFQVGVFASGNYDESFIKILKIIMMCQAMNINVNVDMFDSDTRAIGNGHSYVIVNVAKSSEKLNLKKILICSHEEFFNVSLFNGYSASGQQYSIGTFLNEEQIKRDLGFRYDVIGGNTLDTTNKSGEEQELISRILKIGLK